MSRSCRAVTNAIAHSKQRYRTRKAAGQCVDCGQPNPLAPKVRCESCAVAKKIRECA